MTKSCYLLGIDIETGGPIIDVHPLLAIGMSLYKWDDKGLRLLDTIEVHMHADESEYDPDTLKWWKRQFRSWDVIRKDCISKTEAAERLIAFIKRWQLVAVKEGRPFKIITDNCWFDDTWTSWFLCVNGKHVGGRPLRQNYYTGYTRLDNMIDINQRIKAANSDLGIIIGPYTPTVPHDHTPVSDSRGIVERYVNYMNVTKSWRIKYQSAK